MGTKIGMLVARGLDIPNFSKDVPNFVNNVPIFLKNVSRVPEFILSGEEPPITFSWVPKGTNEP